MSNIVWIPQKSRFTCIDNADLDGSIRFYTEQNRPDELRPAKIRLSSVPIIENNPLMEMLNWYLYSFDEINEIRNNVVKVDKSKLVRSFWDIKDFHNWLENLNEPIFIETSFLGTTDSWNIYSLNSQELISERLTKIKNHPFQISPIITNAVPDNLRKWLNENIPRRFYIDALNLICFKNIDDAILFKLKWAEVFTITEIKNETSL